MKRLTDTYRNQKEKEKLPLDYTALKVSCSTLWHAASLMQAQMYKGGKVREPAFEQWV